MRTFASFYKLGTFLFLVIMVTGWLSGIEFGRNIPFALLLVGSLSSGLAVMWAEYDVYIDCGPPP